MGVIFMPTHHIWQMLQCAHILSMSMHCHTGNMYCGAVLNVLVSIFLTKKQLKNMTKQHPQLCFTFTGHGKEVVDGLNTVDKRYIYQLSVAIWRINTSIVNEFKCIYDILCFNYHNFLFFFSINWFLLNINL